MGVYAYEKRLEASVRPIASWSISWRSGTRKIAGASKTNADASG